MLERDDYIGAVLVGGIMLAAIAAEQLVFGRSLFPDLNPLQPQMQISTTIPDTSSPAGPR